MAESVSAGFVAMAIDRPRLARLADGLATAVVVSLPWSSSATLILIVAWAIVLLPTLDLASLRREVLTPAGGLPVLLCLLGIAGMLWADVPLRERLGGVDSFLKLLAVPMLLAQFRRSENGHWVVLGFLASAILLLIVSWIDVLLLADMLWRSSWKLGQVPGIPVKDYMSQGVIFQLCIFGLAYVAVDVWQHRRWLAVGLLALAGAFLANLSYVITGRTVLVAMPVLLVLFGLRRLSLKGTAGVLLVAIPVAALYLLLSPYQSRLTGIADEIARYRTEYTSAGARVEFWTKSVEFVRQAPIIGHGTGSIRDLFRRAAQGTDVPAAQAPHNPHQQVLAVAIQLGMVGTIVLIAMWLAHLWLFRGPGLVAWLGLLVVVQNLVGSLFNSHLFDLTHGWLYVLGVGVLGGMVLRQAAADRTAAARMPGGP